METAECFENPAYLQAAISCSNDCAALMSELESASPLPNICPVHFQETTRFCGDCRVVACNECTNEQHHGHNCKTSAEVSYEETANLGKIAMTANNLLKEIENSITGVQSTKLNAQERKEENLQTTKEAFFLLRKALDDRERHLLQQINVGAERKDNALNVQQEKLSLLGAQVRNHLNLVNQAAVSKLRVDRLYNSTVILQQRMKDLVAMKNVTTVEPVRKEQALVKFSGVQQLCQDVSNFGYLPFNGSVEYVWEHTVPVDRCASLTITVRDVSDACVSVKVDELEAKVCSPTDNEVLAVIKDIGRGQYNVSFVPETIGNHDISILVAGEPVPQSPYRIIVKDCQQMDYQIISHYEGKQFIAPNDITVGPNEEILVADTGNDCVVVMNKNLDVVTVIGKDDCDGKLSSPYGVAVSHDFVAVSEPLDHQVKKFSLQGKFLSVLGYKELDTPKGVAFDTRQQLFVADSGSNRVVVYNSSDNFSFAIKTKGSGEGELYHPTRIAIDSFDNIYVTGYSANCVHVFTSGGHFINRFSCHKPGAVAVAPDGTILTGHSDDKIRVWNSMSKVIQYVTRKDIDHGVREFDGINGIGVNKYGIVYIVKLWNT